MRCGLLEIPAPIVATAAEYHEAIRLQLAEDHESDEVDASHHGDG